MIEPPRNKIGLYVINYRKEKAVLAHTQTKRGRRWYTFLFPDELKFIVDEPWELCVERLQLYYVETHKSPRRRSKTAPIKVRQVQLKPKNFDRGNSIGTDKSNLEDYATMVFDQPTTFDVNKYSRELE